MQKNKWWCFLGKDNKKYRRPMDITIIISQNMLGKQLNG